MANLDQQQFFLRLGEHDTATQRTNSSGVVSSPNTTLYWYPYTTGSAQLTGGREVVEVQTVHQDKGIRYTIPGQRNANTASVTFPVFPSRAGLLMNAVTSYESTGLPAYHRIDRYWNANVLDNLSSPAEIGASFEGCLFDGFTLDINRNQISEVSLQAQLYINANRQLTGTQPTVSSTGPSGFQGWPSESPYTVAQAYIDVRESGGTYAGDRTEIQQISLTFGNAIEVKNFGADTDAELNQSWKTPIAGTATLTGSIVVGFSDPYWENIARGSAITTLKFRIMLVGSSPSASTTTTESNAATASSVVITVADASGFAAGDVCLITDVDNDRVCVSTISSISSNDITFNKLDVAIDGSGSNAATIQNTALEIEAPAVDVTGDPTDGADGAQATLTIPFTGRVTTTTTSLLEVAAYNDDG